MIQYEYVNEKGKLLAEKIETALELSGGLPPHLGGGSGKGSSGSAAVVFIGSLGICVRKILPLVSDKHTDPAVVCVDTTGKWVIPVLSGHVGGANDLARAIAAAIGAEAVITTQSDNAGLWALDTLARQYGWAEAFAGRNINKEIAAFVNGEPTALLIEADDEGTQHLLGTLPSHVLSVTSEDEIRNGNFALAIIVSPYKHSLNDIPMLQYIPKVVHAGIGLAHQAMPADVILDEIHNCIEAHGIYPQAIKEYDTIDVKADEPVVKLLQERGATVRFHTADELKAIETPNPSAVVASHVGTPSVSEAAAMLHGSLILPKQKGTLWTLALSQETIGLAACPPPHLGGGSGKGSAAHIEIVGAGPGDPDLISVRGRRFLEQADLILYAGSLVPRELTDCHKPGAEVRSSADMDLEEQFHLMKEYYDRGKLVVRLHTGDPCIYGAIQEQMAFFDKYGMHYHITPGISSFLAAAAELQSQFTIPERCQTIILTRGEGRTPMPDKEKLHLLAQHQSTMCIFLSASLAEQVQAELLAGGYPPETPVAACHKLTWKDQKIYRGQLKDLAQIMHDNHLTLTTMIVIGDAIDNREGLSKLYDGKFTHLFRKGKE